jgi:hypothetical protein
MEVKLVDHHEVAPAKVPRLAVHPLQLVCAGDDRCSRHQTNQRAEVHDVAARLSHRASPSASQRSMWIRRDAAARGTAARFQPLENTPISPPSAGRIQLRHQIATL